MRMQLELLENGATSIADAICECIARYRHVCLSSAFITLEGLALVREAVLGRLERDPESRIRVLTGTYQLFTEPDALDLLVEWSQEFGAAVETRVFKRRTPPFHKKMYLFRDYASEGGQVVVVGSSNLTANMQVAEEACLLLRAKAPNATVRRMWESFDKDFSDDNSFVPNARFLSEYRQAHSKAHVLRGKMPPPPRASGQVKREGPGSRKPRLFLDWCSGVAGREECRAVELQTNWETKGWSWYCFNHAKAFETMRSGDRVLMVDYGKTGRTPRVARLCTVRDTGRDVRTSRFDHFVAYTYDAGRTVRLDRKGSTLSGMLRQIGVLPPRRRRLDEWVRVPPAAAEEVLQWVREQAGAGEG